MRISAIVGVSCLLLVVSGVVVGACEISTNESHGVDLCDLGTSKCSADAVPSPADQAKTAQGCREALAGPCFAQAQAALACIAEKQKCGPDNKTDTVALFADCKAEQTALTTCFSPDVDSGGGPAADSGPDSSGGDNMTDAMVTPNSDSGVDTGAPADTGTDGQ